MSSPNPFDVEIIDSSGFTAGHITQPKYLQVVVRHNGVDNAQIRVGVDDPVAPVLSEEGASIRITYRGEFLTSGRIQAFDGDVAPDGEVAFQMRGDYSWLDGVAAWVRPDGPGYDFYQYWETAPTGYYHWNASTNTVETAVRELIQANAGHFDNGSVAVFEEADQRRGGNIRAAGLLPLVRFQYLGELLRPMLAWGGLQLTLQRPPGGIGVKDSLPPDRAVKRAELVAKIRQTTPWPSELTVGSGVIVDGKYSIQRPVVTRVIVGGPGEDKDRLFMAFRDSELEKANVWATEVFKDATNITLNWPSVIAQADRRPVEFLNNSAVPESEKASVRAQFKAAADKAFVEGMLKSGVDIRLSESEGFHFHGPDGIHLGDPVRVRIGSGESARSYSDLITECTLTLTEDDFTVTPQLGMKSDDQDQKLAKTIQSVATSQRSLSTGR